MDKSKVFYPRKFSGKIEFADEGVNSIYDIALKIGRYGDQFLMNELTLLLEAKIMAAKESSKEIKVKLPAPSLLDFVLRRQKTVSVTIDAYDVMPNLSENVKFRIFDFNQSDFFNEPGSCYLTKDQILAFLRFSKIKLKRK